MMSWSSRVDILSDNNTEKRKLGKSIGADVYNLSDRVISGFFQKNAMWQLEIMCFI